MNGLLQCIRVLHQACFIESQALMHVDVGFPKNEYLFNSSSMKTVRNKKQRIPKVKCYRIFTQFHCLKKKIHTLSYSLFEGKAL